MLTQGSTMLMLFFLPSSQPEHSGCLSQGSQIESFTAPPRFLFLATPRSLPHPRSRQVLFLVRAFSTVGEASWVVELDLERLESEERGAHPTSKVGGRPFESVPLWQKKKKKN